MFFYCNFVYFHCSVVYFYGNFLYFHSFYLLCNFAYFHCNSCHPPSFLVFLPVAILSVSPSVCLALIQFILVIVFTRAVASCRQFAPPLFCVISVTVLYHGDCLCFTVTILSPELYYSHRHSTPHTHTPSRITHAHAIFALYARRGEIRGNREARQSITCYSCRVTWKTRALTSFPRIDLTSVSPACPTTPAHAPLPPPLLLHVTYMTSDGDDIKRKVKRSPVVINMEVVGSD